MDRDDPIGWHSGCESKFPVALRDADDAVSEPGSAAFDQAIDRALWLRYARCKCPPMCGENDREAGATGSNTTYHASLAAVRAEEIWPFVSKYGHHGSNGGEIPVGAYFA